MIAPAIAFVVLVVLLARFPFVRRLAVRNARRRPREAVLVVIGAVTATAIVTASLVVAEAVRDALAREAFESLGPIDELVVAPNVDTWTRASERLAAADDRTIEGIAPLAVLPAATTAHDGTATASKSHLIEVDFLAAARLGDEGGALPGYTPRPGRAVVSGLLAAKLDVGEGDVVIAHAFRRALPVTIDAVAPRSGIAAFRWGFDAQSENVFVAPGTIAQLASDAPPGVAGPSWLIAVGNAGDGAAAIDLTDEALAAITSASRGLPVDALPLKREAREAVIEGGRTMTTIQAAMGGFGIIAAILLIINVFAMLAEERTPELGMMRAVGLRRGTLVAAFCVEGCMYALAGAVTGAAAGLGLGFVMISLLDNVYDTVVETFALDIRFDAQLGEYLLGAAAGLGVSLATIGITAMRISRLEVIRAIRDLPERSGRRRRTPTALAGLVVAGLSAAWIAAGAASGEATSLLVGPAFLAGGIAIAASSVVSPRGMATLASLFAIVWAAILGPALMRDTGLNVLPVVAQGVTLVAAAVLLVTQQQDRIARVLRWSSAGDRGLATRLGLAYPLARRTRSALTLAPFAIVVFTVSFVTMLAAIVQREVTIGAESVKADFDVLVDASRSDPVDLDQLAEQPGVHRVAGLAREAAIVTPDGGTPLPWIVTAFDDSLLGPPAPRLVDRGGYASDGAAYRAVMRDPGLILVPVDFLFSGGAPMTKDVRRLGPWRVGDRFTVTDPVSDSATTLTVAGLLPGDMLFNGGLIGHPAAEALFGRALTPSRSYVDADADGIESVRQVIAARYGRRGAEAIDLESLTRLRVSYLHQLLNMFRAYLALGLLAGTAGLAVVMIRAVRERRHEIGVLRAVGFEAGHIRRMFVFEAAFLAVEGIVAGLAMGLLTAYTTTRAPMLTSAFGHSLEYVVPVVGLVTTAAVILLCALLAAATPARTAAAVSPAIALRAVD